jgi:hypothetical protein
MGGDHYTTREAKYHSRVKVMDKINAVEKPTTSAEAQDRPTFVSQ